MRIVRLVLAFIAILVAVACVVGATNERAGGPLEPERVARP